MSDNKPSTSVFVAEQWSAADFEALRSQPAADPTWITLLREAGIAAVLAGDILSDERDNRFAVRLHAALKQRGLISGLDLEADRAEIERIVDTVADAVAAGFAVSTSHPEP